MPITIEELQQKISSLPEELYNELSDFVDALSGKDQIPEWQKAETRRRMEDYRQNLQRLVSECEMEAYLNALENEE